VAERVPDARAIPILPARDLGATAEFYERIGFEEVGHWPEYLILQRWPLELHFYSAADVDPATSIAGCYLRVESADLIWDEVAATDLPQRDSGFPRLQGPVATTDYDMREFAVVDPDGNLLRVGSPVL
jgi:catechol 2,3-dioxygenase-like lactoylglutathione lyase family enzyme